MRFDTGLLFVPQTTPQQEKQNKKKRNTSGFLQGAYAHDMTVTVWKKEV